MPLFAPKTEDNTIESRHKYRLLSPSISFYLLLSPSNSFYLLLSPSISFYLLLSSVILSCTGGTVFHSYKPLPAEGWERRDTVCFPLPQQTEDINGTLTIGLRASAPVGMQDIVLAVEQCLQSPAAYRCDTVRYPLTDAVGNVLGKGVNTIQYETQQLPIHAQKGQSGIIRIHHIMNRETVSGITELGIKVN